MALRTPVNDQDHIEGNPSAAIVLLEYGDYQCPYCQKAYRMVKQMQQELGSNLKLAFRNFPLNKIHPDAKAAAIASEAAARQGKYWEMHDHLFENHTDFSREKLIEFAQALGLDTETFTKDIDDVSLAEKVDSDFYGGMRSGVSATPTFYINNEKFEGNWMGGELKDRLLELAKAL